MLEFLAELLRFKWNVHGISYVLLETFSRIQPFRPLALRKPIAVMTWTIAKYTTNDVRLTLRASDHDISQLTQGTRMKDGILNVLSILHPNSKAGPYTKTLRPEARANRVQEPLPVTFECSNFLTKSTEGITSSAQLHRQAHLGQQAFWISPFQLGNGGGSR